MIHIHITEAPPEDWQEKAANLSRRLENAASQEERNKIIEDNSAVWSELKNWLLGFSYGKCWFSEARDCISHWEVEHFRPKKIARDLDGTEHEGYWWLAFDWKNFRISGNVVNRKKGGYFPLHESSRRASSVNRNIDDELYVFLDPTVLHDTTLVSFDESGAMIAPKDLTEDDQARVQISIEKFKLNDYQPLIDGRKEIWNTCRILINECENKMKEYQSSPSATKRAEIEEKNKSLQMMLSPRAPFSATAAACLLASGLSWAKTLACSPRRRD